MILAFIGGVVLVIGIGNGTVPTMVIGGILVALGLLFISASDEDVRARMNLKRYWVYGDEPDWKKQRRRWNK